MAEHLEVIIGTYEEFLLGYTIEISTKENEKYDFKQSFATHSHTASIKCVDSCGKYLASGGSDDRIIIYDMKNRSEAQILTHHESSINAVKFTPDCSHLITGGEDGKLSAIRTGSWVLEKQWKKAHEGHPVQYISIHPSGKLALTIGQDLVMKTWNLVKGRLAYATNLKSKPTLGRIVNCVIWSPDGNYFTITGAKVVEVWSITTASIINFHECECKPLMVCWLNNTKQIIGLENGKGLIYDMENDMTKEYEICNKRIKDIKCYNNYVFTASSLGNVTLWEYSNDSNDLIKLLNINIGCRPTCLTIIDRSKFDYKEIVSDQAINEVKQLPEIQNIIKKKKTIGTVEIEIEDNDEIQNKNPINQHKKHLLEDKSESNLNITKKTKKNKRLSMDKEFISKEKTNIVDNNKTAKLNSEDHVSNQLKNSLKHGKKNKLNQTADITCDKNIVKNKKQRRSIS